MIDSERTSFMPFYHDEANVIEKNMLDDGFRTWGIVIYRCTYKSDSNLEEFVRRFLYHVRDTLECYDGLDLLNAFVPTVTDNKTRFDGITPSIVIISTSGRVLRVSSKKAFRVIMPSG